METGWNASEGGSSHPEIVMTPAFRRLALAAALATLYAAPVHASDLTVAPHTVRFADGSEMTAERGVFTVPENRDDPASRRIEIAFVRLKSTAANPGAPIVYLAGGPGGSGIDILSTPRGAMLRRLTAVADVIALDQRGTGQSNAIPPCAPDIAVDQTRLTSESITRQFRQGFTQCLDFWRAAGVDPAGYDLLDSADDLEDLRQALGVEKLNLLAISFGPQLGMTYMKRHPERVERAVFASPRGLDHTLRSPAGVDAFLNRVMDPETLAVMRRVHERLDREPVRVTVVPREGAAPVEVGFDSFPVRLITAFFYLNSKAVLERLPELYRQMDGGDYDAFAKLILEVGMTPGRGRFVAFRGMGEMIDIASNASAGNLARWRAEVGGSVLGDAHGFPMPQAMGLGGLDIPDAYKHPLVSDTPTMFISSTHDGRTPLETMPSVMQGFSRATLTRVVGGGHNVFEQSEPLQAEILAFLSDGSRPSEEIVLP